MTPKQLRASARVFSIQGGLLNGLAERVGELATENDHDEAPLRQIVIEALALFCDVAAQALTAAADAGEPERLN
jgi:hypothetical protein